jgi:hypothetical protein
LLSDDEPIVQGAFDVFSRGSILPVIECHIKNNHSSLPSLCTTIGHVIRLQIPEFALLLACHTTVGIKPSPDEAIHLAAAMHF